MRVDYYVDGFINGKIISWILWYHMHLEESRTLHAFINWWVESLLEHVNWCICELVNFWWLLWILEKGELYVYLIELVYSLIEFVNHVKLNCVIYFHLIMFNYRLWTNPEWSFGWPSTLFVWMDRRCARLVASLGELLEDSFGATSFCLESLESGSDLGASVCLFYYVCSRFWGYVLMMIWVVWWHWLFGDVLFDEIYYYSVVIYVIEKKYLCMLLNLFEDVTFKFLYNRMISVIYRFKGLECYRVTLRWCLGTNLVSLGSKTELGKAPKSDIIENLRFLQPDTHALSCCLGARSCPLCNMRELRFSSSFEFRKWKLRSHK